MEFTKMQGLGNDYVYVNCLRETIKNPAEVSKFVTVSRPEFWNRFGRVDYDLSIQGGRF